MKLRQLRSLTTLAESGFNVTQTAKRLHLVQPAVSQHLIRLEEELGVEIFKRQGKRLLGLTTAGEKILHYARKTLAECDNILAVGRDHVDESIGTLRIGTTHTQARYVLPAIIRQFRKNYPHVNLQIHQGTPLQLVEMTTSDRVDLAICTEELGETQTLEAIPCYRWNRSLIAPAGHPVFNCHPLQLNTICEFPIVTYVFSFTGGNNFRKSFSRLGLQPQVVLSAADTDVIKTYVREGLGIGIIASLAYSETTDSDLQILDLSNLFPWEVTRIAYNRDKYLRHYEEHFIKLLQAMVADNGIIVERPTNRTN